MRPQQSPTRLSYQKMSVQTQSRLIDTFSQHQVPEFYQNIFINYIKNQYALQAQLTMREEIQSLANNSSFIQSFNKCFEDKEKYEGYIRLVLGYQKQTYESQAAKIIKICELIMHLRDLYFKCANFLLKIRLKYEQNVHIYQSVEKYYYNIFAIKLDSFRKQLQKSQLSQHIDFQKEYDPFFIHLKLKQYHKDQKCNEALLQMMQFSVEDSYKYLKMEKIMTEWLYMHSKKKILQKRLERIDLPELKATQVTYQNDNFKEKLQRYSRIFNRDNDSHYFRENRSSILDMDSADGRKIEFDLNREQELFSLDKYEKQKKQREKEQIKRDYLNDNINKLLQKNMQTPQKPAKNKFRVRTQASSKEPEASNGPTFVGRIKRFQISNFRTLQNSPLGHESKKSETLPLHPLQQLKKDSLNDNKNQQTNISKSPTYFCYDSTNNLLEQKSRSISKERIKLQKINAYSITIRGRNINNSNQKAENTAAGKNEMIKNNKNQSLAQNNQNKGSKKIDPELTSTLRQSQDFKFKDQEIEDLKKRQPKFTKSNLSAVEEEREKNEDTRKRNTFDRNQPIKRIQKEQRQVVKKSSLLTSNKYRPKEDTIKETDEEMNPSLPTKRSDQEDLIKQNSTTNPPKSVSQNYQPYQPKIATQLYQPKIIYQSHVPKTQEQPTTDKNKVQPKKEIDQVIPQKTKQKELDSNQNTQTNNTSQVQKSKIPQKKIEQPTQKKLEQPLQKKIEEPPQKKVQQIPQKKIEESPQKKVEQPIQKKVEQPQRKVEQPPQKKIEQPVPAKQVPKKSQSVNKSESNLKSNEIKDEKKQIKMRVGKYTISSFKQYLRKYSFHKDSLKIFEVDKISKELQFQQTYITQFLINGQPAVLAIIYLIANCKLILRMWALQEKQDPNLSLPLFKKFIDYVQKQCTGKYIYYKGAQFPELSKVGFVLKKDDLYERKRTVAPKQVQHQFQQCISLQCSQIKFIQKQKEDILVSAQIQNFTVQNSRMSQFLINMKDEALPPKMKGLVKISHGIESFAILNKILQKQDCDSYQATSKIVVQNIDLSLVNFLSIFRDIFVASDGFIKFFGIVVKETKQQCIYSIKLSNNNGRVCFCRGYNSAQQVQNDLKAQSSSKKQEFWVPMFNKKLYGRYKNYKNPNQVCYANWDISFFWQDELQGALKYPQRGGVKFQQSSFYVSIQLQGNLLYIFEVSKGDYIY